MGAIGCGALTLAAAGLQAPPDLPSVQAAADPVIVVTGTRLPRPSEDNPSPTQTVNGEAFVLTGVPNVEQTLNQLPQLTPTFTNTSNNPGTGAATLSLRGLGSVRTLILVNGRRWIANNAGQSPEVDVNTIPAALIERVDVVTGGASAVYGSDAVTGVINFVLQNRLEGLRLDARQNLTEQGDGSVSAADISFGTAFGGGRGRIVGSVGWLDQAPITAEERPLARVSLQDGCGVPGTRDATGASRPVAGPCLTPNLITLIAGGSLTIPGGRIGGNVLLPVPGATTLQATAPFGVRFDRNGLPRIFDTAVDRYNFAPENYLQVGLRRWSVHLLAGFEAEAWFRPYAEASYIVTESPQQLAAVPAMLPALRMNLDNPFLTPAARSLLEINYGVDAQGNRGFLGSPAAGWRLNPAFAGDADGFVTIPNFGSRLDLGPRRIVNRREATRGLLGVGGALTPGWDYDIFYSHSLVEHRAARENSGSASRLRQAALARRDPTTGAIACIDPSGGCAPANLFGAGLLDPAAADFVRTHPTDFTTIEEQVAEASVRGEVPLFRAGPAGLALGASWRRTAYAFRPDPSLFSGDDLGFQPGTPASGSTRVWELFGEARLPLLPGLSAELGLRWSSHDRVGGEWTWKALGEWTPLAGLRIRGGLQRAVRAPNVRELFEETTRQFGGSLDPCSAAFGLLHDPQILTACRRNGVQPGQENQIFAETFSLTETGGNPDLDSEVARTTTLGAVVAPRLLPGLSLTLDYYDVRIRSAIGRLGGGNIFLVYGCLRGGADPADPLCAAYQRGPDGTIALSRYPSSNLPEVRARGIDWQLAFARTFGRGRRGAPHRLDLQLTGTRYLENSFVPNPHLPAYDCAGLFGFPCGNTVVGAATPAWKLFNQLAWTAGDVMLSLRHRWFSATRDAREVRSVYFGADPVVLPEEGRRLESRHYIDLAVIFVVGETYRLTLGVNNLTGARPAVTGTNQVQLNTDPSLYDVLGRRYFVALSARYR